MVRECVFSLSQGELFHHDQAGIKQRLVFSTFCVMMITVMMLMTDSHIHVVADPFPQKAFHFIEQQSWPDVDGVASSLQHLATAEQPPQFRLQVQRRVVQQVVLQDAASQMQIGPGQLARASSRVLVAHGRAMVGHESTLGRCHATTLLGGKEWKMSSQIKRWIA